MAYNVLKCGPEPTTATTSVITDTVAGNLIATHDNGDGVITPINETLTGVVLANGDIVYTKEDGTTDTIVFSRIAKYSNTDTTTNINTVAWTDIPLMGNAVITNPDFTQAGDTLTVNVSGVYRLTANISYNGTNVPGNGEQRTAVSARFAVGGVKIPDTAEANTGYIRWSQGHLESSGNMTEVVELTAGSVLSVQSFRDGNSGPIDMRVAGSSNFSIERIN